VKKFTSIYEIFIEKYISRSAVYICVAWFLWTPAKTWRCTADVQSCPKWRVL